MVRGVNSVNKKNHPQIVTNDTYQKFELGPRGFVFFLVTCCHSGVATGSCEAGGLYVEYTEGIADEGGLQAWRLGGL